MRGKSDARDEIPDEILEQFKYTPVYCTECELPVSVTVDPEDPEIYNWECSCSVGYPSAELPDAWQHIEV